MSVNNDELSQRRAEKEEKKRAADAAAAAEKLAKEKAAAEAASEQNDLIARMNIMHAVVTIGGKTSIMNERESKQFPGRIDRTFSQRDDLQLQYANERYRVGFSSQGKPVIRSADALWLEAPLRRQYDDVIFDPTMAPRGDEETRIYNLWHGWPTTRDSNFFKPSAMNKWKLVRAFLLDVIANGDKRMYRWICAWIAERLKHPEKTGGVAIVLMGGEGIGKGFFARALVGGFYNVNHFMQITDPQHITGRFNQHLEDALLVFVDEAFFASDPTIKGKLYAFITEPEILLEAKFKMPIRFPNRRSFILASNDAHVVPAGAGARRYAVLKVNESHKEDRKYFAALAKELDSGGREEMLRWLLQENFNDVDVYRAPMTDALMEQKELGFSGVERYWFDCVLNARLPQEVGPDQSWSTTSETWVPVSKFVSDFLASAYMQHAHERTKRAAETELGIALAKFIPTRQISRRRNPDGKRPTHWILPPLSKAQDGFNEHLGAPYPWETPPMDAKKGQK